MRNKLGILRISSGCLTAGGCLLLVACGSSDGSGSAAVLTQAPHCTEDEVLKIEGTIAGAAIDDVRTTNVNAAQENFSDGKFYTPFSSLAPLASNQLALTFTWPHSLFNGQTSAIGSGTLTLPATHPQAGAMYCVSAGQVGFVDGGSEDFALKFAISQVKAGADCSGPPIAVDLRGCYK